MSRNDEPGFLVKMVWNSISKGVLGLRVGLGGCVVNQPGSQFIGFPVEFFFASLAYLQAFVYLSSFIVYKSRLLTSACGFYCLRVGCKY